MLIGSGDEIEGPFDFVKKVGLVAVNPALAVQAIAARKVIGAAMAKGAPPPPPDARACGLWDRVMITFGSKNRGCKLPSGELAGEDMAAAALTRYAQRSARGRRGSLGELGIAPLVAAALLPVATSAAGAAARAIGNIGKKAAPPPCSFFQRVSKVFGGKPPCS